MGHYDGRDLPFYWNVAGEYVLFDHWFASSPGGSVATMYRSPRRAGRRLPGAPSSTIFDRLERAGHLVEVLRPGLRPAPAIGAGGTPDTSAQAVRVPVLNIVPVRRIGRSLLRHIVDLDEYYEDLRSGNAAAGRVHRAGGRAASIRRGGRRAGQTLVRSLLTSLARSRAWPHAAFMWTYDEWGGWYDHVRPPAGRGFRVPALLVSPYARRGVVDSTVLEHASILSFIEHNWGVRPLSRRDQRANDLTSAFDFGQPARAAAIIPASRSTNHRAEPRRWVIYLWYGAAVLLAVALIRRAGRRRAAPAPLAALAVALVLGPAPAPAHAADRVPSVIQTNPPAPGMRFSVDGVVFAADGSGRAHPPPAAVGTSHSVRALDTPLEPGVRARFDRWYGAGTVAALNLDHRVRLRFVDLAGRPVDPDMVDSVTLLGSNGERRTFRGATTAGSRATGSCPRAVGEGPRWSSYAAERVVVTGAGVVHRAQQRFFPARTPEIAAAATALLGPLRGRTMPCSASRSARPCSCGSRTGACRAMRSARAAR